MVSFRCPAGAAQRWAEPSFGEWLLCVPLSAFRNSRFLPSRRPSVPAGTGDRSRREREQNESPSHPERDQRDGGKRGEGGGGGLVSVERQPRGARMSAQQSKTKEKNGGIRTAPLLRLHDRILPSYAVLRSLHCCRLSSLLCGAAEGGRGVLRVTHSASPSSTTETATCGASCSLMQKNILRPFSMFVRRPYLLSSVVDARRGPLPMLSSPLPPTFLLRPFRLC